jgi:hypothetical protein
MIRTYFTYIVNVGRFQISEANRKNKQENHFLIERNSLPDNIFASFVVVGAQLRPRRFHQIGHPLRRHSNPFHHACNDET